MPAARDLRANQPQRPLVVCNDEQLLDDLLRLAAAAGCEPLVAHDAGAARRGWAEAALVLVGADQAEACAGAGLPRRSEVVLVTGDQDDERVWRRALALGAEQVAMLPDAEPWLVDRLADAAEGGSGGLVLCVAGGRGGAGASTLAAALAFAGTRRGQTVVLVDGDPLGGGLDLVLGGEDAPGLRWPDLASASGRVSPSHLAASLPEVERLTVLSWDRGDLLEIPVHAMESVLRAASSAADLVVVDLPRRLDEPTLAALRAADCTYLVVPAELRAIAAASRMATALGPRTARLSVAVRGPSPGGLDADDVADALGLPLGGRCRAEPGLAAALERGEAPGRSRGPLARLADALLAQAVEARSTTARAATTRATTEHRGAP